MCVMVANSVRMVRILKVNLLGDPCLKEAIIGVKVQAFINYKNNSKQHKVKNF